MINYLKIKAPIEGALADLKKSFEAKDVDGVDKHMEALNTLFQAASQEMYSQEGQAEGAPNENGGPEGGEAQTDDEVTDVDFEEVK